MTWRASPWRLARVTRVASAAMLSTAPIACVMLLSFSSTRVSQWGWVRLIDVLSIIRQSYAGTVQMPMPEFRNESGQRRHRAADAPARRPTGEDQGAHAEAIVQSCLRCAVGSVRDDAGVGVRRQRERQRPCARLLRHLDDVVGLGCRDVVPRELALPAGHGVRGALLGGAQDRG